MTKKELREKTNEELERLYNFYKKEAIERLDNKIIPIARRVINEMQKVVDIQLENEIGE